MMQIVILLLGAEYIKKYSFYLFLSGIIWMMVGVLLFIDAIDGLLYFPLRVFGIILLVESLITIIASTGVSGTKKIILSFKGGIFILIALIVLINDSYSGIILALIFGFTYFILGTFTLLSAWVVRFPRWGYSLAYGIVLVLFSFFLITQHAATVSYFLGFQLVASGFSCIAVARRAATVRSGRSAFNLIEFDDTLHPHAENELPQNDISPAPDNAPVHHELIVHIWTPVGSLRNRTVSPPVINRYIAAVDEQGIISTGHAALEVPGHAYISLYPAEDIDRTPSEFMRLLRATHDNDVAGIFQPDYGTESSHWCESDRKIVFRNYNISQLLHFWESYQKEKIYNLTYRNCSSTVAYALESALDGVLNKKGFIPVVKLLLTPELWLASQVRKRALSMAWTPGLVMDYARALYGILYANTPPHH